MLSLSFAGRDEDAWGKAPQAIPMLIQKARRLDAAFKGQAITESNILGFGRWTSRCKNNVHRIPAANQDDVSMDVGVGVAEVVWRIHCLGPVVRLLWPSQDHTACLGSGTPKLPETVYAGGVE
eukprot:2758743-Amphidinium_carterae.2